MITTKNPFWVKCKRAGWLLVIISFIVHSISAQSKIPLDDLSFFEAPGNTWRIVSDVKADLSKKNFLETAKGTGVLANVTDKKNIGADLFSKEQFGDMDLELDYLMAAGSNSGIYLQGRYEIQLLDSWTSTQTKPGDNGGIYERWDESKPDGQKGYEGYSPRQNVSRAPGLWQHLKISFQAPRFDASGKKTANAKILSVELNGVVVHEDIELFGPTRGAVGNEAPLGPLRIQGDHGSVAFRNINITHYDKSKPVISKLDYEIFSGRFTREDQIVTAQPVIKGSAETLTTEMSNVPNTFAIRYKGIMDVKEAGNYQFDMTTFGGVGQLTLGGDKVIAPTEWAGKGNIALPEGKIPVTIFYSKYVDWAQPVLNLKISGPGIREYSLNESPPNYGRPVDPIYVHATSNTLLRSFVDLPGNIRVTHAVSVGTPEKVHYTYDMDNGSIVQLWRGEFLDATPMWHDRGDGSSRARGAALHFAPIPTVEKLSSSTTTWARDTTGTRFRTKGYKLTDNDQPTFIYQLSGATISDAITLLNGGQGISRTLTIQNGGAGFYVRLAEGTNIERISDDLYLINDKAYYLKLETKDVKPIIRESDGVKEMLMPVQNKITYSIIF